MKLEIKEGTYLNSDNKCYWITKEKKNSKTEQMEEKRFTGYFGRIDQLLDDYFESHIRESKPEDIKELRSEVKAAKEEVREIGATIQKNLKELING